MSPMVFGRERLRIDRETAGEIKRHFNVVAESLPSEIHAVAESLQGFCEEVSTEFSAVREEVGDVSVSRGVRSIEYIMACCQSGPRPTANAYYII